MSENIIDICSYRCFLIRTDVICANGVVMIEKKPKRKAMGISLPQEMYERIQCFGSVNWSAVCRGAIEMKLRALEAERNQNRYEELRIMAEADSEGMREKGYEDGLNYPLQDLDYRKLRELSLKVEPLIENNDPENIIDALDRMKEFRLSHSLWEYKLGFVDGLLRLKKISEMSEHEYKREILKK